MNAIILIISACVTAMALENPVFGRALGLGRESMFLRSPRQCLFFGGTLTWMAVAGSFFVALTNFLLIDNPHILILRPIGYFAGIVTVYLVAVKIFRHTFSVDVFGKIRAVMPIAALNSALFGAFYISASQNLKVFETIGYALGSGLGYTAAILIIYFARKRLAISPVPRTFRGMPILLIYLGLISLALYGLIGHALPT